MTELVPGPQRTRLVAELRTRGCVRSPRVADAFATVPRECFVPEVPLERVYRVDEAIPTRFDEDGVPVSSSSAPNIMAVMLEMLAVAEGQRVLEVGAGTGYNAALLSHLVGRVGSVTSIDLDPVVTREAREHLEGAGVGGVGGTGADVRIVTGDGWRGQPGEVFDGMIVTAECWDVSPAWVEQLSVGGRLVLPLWLRPGLTLAVAFEKVAGGTRPGDDVLVSRALAYCGFMPLRGPHEGPPRRALLRDLPWDDRGDGDGEGGGGGNGGGGEGAGDGRDACSANRGRWIAQLDEATDERVGVLTDLLRTPVSSRPAPTVRPGWRFRLGLEHPDPISIFTMFPPRRDAVGLFDADAPSLAVLEGERLHCFGSASGADRLEAWLTASEALEISDLSIRASRHAEVTSASASGSAVLPRPSFDLSVHWTSSGG